MLTQVTAAGLLNCLKLTSRLSVQIPAWNCILNVQDRQGSKWGISLH